MDDLNNPKLEISRNGSALVLSPYTNK